MEDLSKLTEPLKKRLYNLLANMNIRIVRIHLSWPFKAKLRAVGETFESKILDGSEYHLLGYSCQVHHETVDFNWKIEFRKYTEISKEALKEEILFSSDMEEE